MQIDIKNLTKTYGKREVLHVADTQLHLKGCSAIIGPNGAGKSTLIHILAGLINPTSGQILYDGNKAAPAKEMTLVFQKPYLISGTVEMNLRYPMKLRNWPRRDIEARTNQLLEALNITNLRHQKAWKLSGGETQKVALARALSFNPKLLLLDEPTANIDPATTYEIENILTKVSKDENMKIIIVTHNLAQAKRISQKTIVMNKGEIIEQGDTKQLLKTPKREETSAFLRGELLL